ncbi:MAG: FadR/GntR family transcriptional regulator [Alkalilacustris sp.]
MPQDHAALVQLRAYLMRAGLGPDDRLPAERDLAASIGVTRGALRKALAVLEGEGVIWRHVGKGTFLAGAATAETLDLTGLAQRSNPAEVMRARKMLEPALAAEAAIHASPLDLQALRTCCAESRTAPSWRHYEAADNRFHKLVADAAHNGIAGALYDMLAAIRRVVVWSRRREDAAGPPADHHSFAEHDAILAAIAERDPTEAEAAMQRHLMSVERKLFAAGPSAAPGKDATAGRSVA